MTVSGPPKAGPGQESVWDYPKETAIAPSSKRVKIIFDGQVVADTTNSKRLIERGHPPVYYIPREDANMELLEKTEKASHCQWKGDAEYFNVKHGDRVVENAVWSYPDPFERSELVRSHLAFYPHLMDECTVDGEQIFSDTPRQYGFATKDIVGPFKHEPGTEGW